MVLIMKLAYVLLAHQHPDLIIRLVERLTQHDSYVVIHYDLNGGEVAFDYLQSALIYLQDKVFWAKRIKVGWGEWSIIQATLNCLSILAEHDLELDYIHLLSGADYPTRSEVEFKKFLAHNFGTEYIQAVDISREQWVTGGLSHERYQYRHFINWQKRPALFDLSFKLQKKFFPKRAFPNNLTPHMGSQWWTLTWTTCKEILEYSKNPKLVKFFQTVWIPDEMYIQTLVAKVVGKARIANKCLTLYQFNYNGLPLVFTNDHFEYLLKQPFFFARKISPYANQLRNALDQDAKKSKTIDSNLLTTKFGVVSDDYANFLVEHGNLKRKGKRIIGLIQDAWYGDLEWNDKTYYVIVGASRTELKMVQDFLNKQPNIVCHGFLFNENKIDFYKQQDTYADCHSNDILIREHSRPNFLVQVLQQDVNKIVAFLLPFDEGGDLLEMCLWDRNSRFIVLKTNPFMLYYETYKESEFLKSTEQLLDSKVKSQDLQLTEKLKTTFTELAQEYRLHHENFWKRLHTAQPKNLEICLYDSRRVWMSEGLNFIEWNHEQDTGIKISKYLNQRLYDKWLQQYRLIHSNIPHLSRLFYDLSEDEQAVFRAFREPNYGELSWNKKPYLVISGSSRYELMLIQEYLNQIPNVVCHGDLFGEQEIEFAPNIKNCAGYESNDILKRDRYQQDFLARVIQDTKAKLVAFLLPFGGDEFILNVALKDRNAAFVLLKSTTLIAYERNQKIVSSRQKIVPSLAQEDISANLSSQVPITEFDIFYKQSKDHSDYIKQQFDILKKRFTELCFYDTSDWDIQLVTFLNRWNEEVGLHLPLLDSESLQSIARKIDANYNHRLALTELDTSEINRLDALERKIFWRRWQTRYRVL